MAQTTRLASFGPFSLSPRTSGHISSSFGATFVVVAVREVDLPGLDTCRALVSSFIVLGNNHGRRGDVAAVMRVFQPKRW